MAGCERERQAGPLCMAHNSRRHRGTPLGEGFSALPPCAAPACPRQRYRPGSDWCRAHWDRMNRLGSLDLPQRERVERGCSVPGCERRHYGRGLCNFHWQRDRKGRVVDAPIVRRANGTGNIAPDGYVMVVAHGHPNAGPSGRIAQHRLIMSEHLGRPLLPGETVHHVNGDRADNRLENLELWSSSQPSGQRVVDKVAWAKELLALYEPEAIAS